MTSTRWSPASRRMPPCGTRATTIVGTDAIRAWKIETSAKYRITAEPLESRTEGDRTIVVVNVSGTFPGSPANLTYRFGFSADGRIGALEVR